MRSFFCGSGHSKFQQSFYGDKKARNNAAFVEQVLAALDSDSDNEPDNDSDICLLSVDSRTNEGKKERKKFHSSSSKISVTTAVETAAVCWSLFGPSSRLAFSSRRLAP
jgi:hypothetical protein